MRPRSMQDVPGLDPNASPYERFRQFARLIVAVPKTEVEHKTQQLAPVKIKRRTKASDKGTGRGK
jgi:hypothetical protein